MSKRVSKMGWIVLAALLCLSLVILPACTTQVEEGPTISYKNDGTFVEQTIGDLDSLDPAWGYDTASGEQVQYIYEGLIAYDGAKTTQFVGVLATDWSWNPADSTYRFRIRDGVKFAEGGDLTPEDVEYSFERALVQDRRGGPTWMFYTPMFGGGSSKTHTFAEIDAAVEVDGDSVVIKLCDPAWEVAFLQILAGPWSSILDKEWCIAQGDWDGTEATWKNYNRPASESDTVLYEKVNGTGPWKLEEWDHGIQIKLVKNDNYRGSVPFDRVITQVVDEWTNRKLALVNGDADLVYVPRMYIHELDEYLGELNAIKDLPELALDTIFFNECIAEDSSYIGSGALDGEGIPTNFFSDLDVRKGFCYAFDYATFLKDALLNEATQMGGPIIPGLAPDYFNPDARMYSYDLDKAEEHMKAAWNGTLWEKGFKMTLLYNSGNVPRKVACEILAENLASINPLFVINIQPIAWETYLDKIWGTMDMPMFEIGWQTDYPHPDNWVVPYMHSTDGAFSAFQCYGSPEIDAKIHDAFYELDPVKQKADYYELQDIYYTDPGGIMLFQPLGRRWFTKYIDGFVFNPANPGLPGNLLYVTKSES